MDGMFKKILSRLFNGYSLTALIGALVQARNWLPSFWHKASALDTARSMWELAGGNISTLIWITTSPYFGLILIVAGLAGIPTLTDRVPTHSIHRVWAPLGWVIFGIAVCWLGSVSLFGDYLLSSGALEAKRLYIEQHTDRHLTEKQKGIICREIKMLDGHMFDNISITSEPSPESMQYATEIFEYFKSCGAHFLNEKSGGFIEYGPAVSTQNKGFFLVVQDKENPPKAAIALHSILNSAGFSSRYFPGRIGSPDALWIGLR